MNEDDKAYVAFTREKAHYDRVSFMNYLKRVEQEAYEQAKKEESLNVARKILQAGMDLETISSITQLSMDEIQRLKDKK